MKNTATDNSSCAQLREIKKRSYTDKMVKGIHDILRSFILLWWSTSAKYVFQKIKFRNKEALTYVIQVSALNNLIVFRANLSPQSIVVRFTAAILAVYLQQQFILTSHTIYLHDVVPSFCQSLDIQPLFYTARAS